MDPIRYEQLVKTFFTCDPAAIAEIFHELLMAMQAEETLPPACQMEQNYETATANPEIHVFPGNLKDARDTVFPYFWGTDSWSSPLHMENVKGPANYASLVGALACLLKNPNLCTDTYSQRSNELEIKAVTTLANLTFYHTNDPWGVFTMGGTISNLYGARVGIEKVLPGAMQRGLQGVKLAGIVSAAAHYSNVSLAGWLGMGTANLHVIATAENLAMRLDALEEKLEALHDEGVRVAFVVATFGTTDGFGVDDVAGIRECIDRFAARHAVPVPQLHVDAAVGWTLCFLTDYDVDTNPLGFAPELLPVVRCAQALTHGLRVADSVTLDFHKMGWGHYPGSAFLVNRREDLRYLARTVESMPYFSEADSRRDPALFTLECSRPALGPYTVMASLNAIGLTGWQMMIARALELAQRLKQQLEQLDYCKVLNLDTLGPSVVWWVLPKGRDGKAIYQQAVEGRLEPQAFAHYVDEMRRLFERREQASDPAVDARLSYTASIGYCPRGLDLPAWKAVVFNPKTNDEVLDRLLWSIEQL